MRRNQVAQAIAEVRTLLQELRQRVHPNKKDLAEGVEQFSLAQVRTLYERIDATRRLVIEWCCTEADVEPGESVYPAVNEDDSPLPEKAGRRGAEL